jgi:hypothetical protein
MAEALILDSEALSSLAHAGERGAAALRARAILAVAHERRALVRVPTAVLAEVCRGGPRDAAVDRVLHGRGIGLLDLTPTIARRAGALLGAAKLDSTSAVHAFVVATAIALGDAIIATGDPDDLGKLAVKQRSVSVWDISEPFEEPE